MSTFPFPVNAYTTYVAFAFTFNAGKYMFLIWLMPTNLARTLYSRIIIFKMIFCSPNSSYMKRSLRRGNDD